MRFSPGDRVHVSSLGTAIVREVRSRDRYLVELKGRTLVIDAARLAAVETRRRGNRDEQPADPPAAVSPTRAHAASTLDLHGRTAVEAVAALDDFINDAILAGLTTVHVIHGRSGGRVRGAVHARLRELSPVRHFRIDPSNTGVTLVEL